MMRPPEIQMQTGVEARAVRCRAPVDGDALDRELADRLNTYLTASDPSVDYQQPQQLIFREILFWALGTGCLTAAAVVWLV